MLKQSRFIEIMCHKALFSLGAQTKASGSLTPTIAMGDTSVWTANFGQDSSFAGAETAQGNQDANDKGDFYYAVPAGHLSLCTDNLPAPAIALPGNILIRSSTLVMMQIELLVELDSSQISCG